MDFIKKHLNNLQENAQFRKIYPSFLKENNYAIKNGQKLLNLSSNDYLGWAYDENLRREFLEEIDIASFDFSSASSRLLTGNHKVFEELEEYLAKRFNKEQCLLFNNGYQANVGLISALNKKGCAVFSDKLNHASTIDGMKLSQGDFYRYNHLDYTHLERLLDKYSSKYEQIFIATESVFSMDGDIADFDELVALKAKYNAILIVDEAHSFGVFGEDAFGLTKNEEIDIIMGTFGKALASYGAFVVASQQTIEYLVNMARPFIFSTMIAPAQARWTLWLLQKKLPKTLKNRQNLLKNASFLRENINKFGLETRGASQIVPIIIGDNNKTISIAKELENKGFLVLPIRPPTVKIGESRLRVSLHSRLLQEDVEAFIEALGGIL